MSTLTDISKFKYATNNQIPTESEIQTGCMQRVADATEKMADGFQAILYTLKKAEADRDAYQRWYHEQASLVKQREHTIRTLKGVITKSRKEVSRLKGEVNTRAGATVYK